jgi:fructosamine-3-kinase
VEATPLAGGTNHDTWLVTRVDGSQLVLKTTPHLPPDVFDAEAEGLDALRGSGQVGAPVVIDVGPHFLALEALRPTPALDDAAFWERTGRALARLHSRRGRRFGWHRDNWLGLVRQHNTWTGDPYEFFTRYRILRYLPEPHVRAVLDAAELAAVERICERLPQLVPPSYPALTHGDLWHGNVLATADGTPALIDPAVSWSWPEVDLSMMAQCGAPEPFFSAYHDIRPPQPDWRDHLALLHLRELLSVLAHGPRLPDAPRWAVPQVRDLIARYA